MRIILDDFYYGGMLFDHFELDEKELGSSCDLKDTVLIQEKIKEELNRLIYEEACKRG